CTFGSAGDPPAVRQMSQTLVPEWEGRRRGAAPVDSAKLATGSDIGAAAGGELFSERQLVVFGDLPVADTRGEDVVGSDRDEPPCAGMPLSFGGVVESELAGVDGGGECCEAGDV